MKTITISLIASLIFILISCTNDEALLNTLYGYGPSVCDAKICFDENGSGSILIYEYNYELPLLYDFNV
jgi:hypothetical protein